MALPKTDKEWAERTSRYLKSRLKRQNLTYDELAERLKKYGYKNETRASIASKLARGTFPASFLLAALAAMGLALVRLEDV